MRFLKCRISPVLYYIMQHLVHNVYVRVFASSGGVMIDLVGFFQLLTSLAWTGRCGLLLSARITTTRGFSTLFTDFL